MSFLVISFIFIIIFNVNAIYLTYFESLNAYEETVFLGAVIAYNIIILIMSIYIVVKGKPKEKDYF